ncbi:MAG: 50S ribosomal protein L20 [Phycisphaerales bacterium]
MPRVRKGSARKRQHNRVLREARGYFGTKSRHYQQAKVALMRARRFAWRDRRALKRNMRALWITRITAACRMRGTRYSLFMNGLKHSGIMLNRKMLSEIAIHDPSAFDQIVETAIKASKATPATAKA